MNRISHSAQLTFESNTCDKWKSSELLVRASLSLNQRFSAASTCLVESVKAVVVVIVVAESRRRRLRIVCKVRLEVGTTDVWLVV